MKDKLTKYFYLIRVSQTFFPFYLVCFEEKVELLWSLDRHRAKTYVAHYSSNIKGINTKLAHHDKMQLQNKGHNSDSDSFGVMPLFYLKFLNRMMALKDENRYCMQCSCLSLILWNKKTAKTWKLPVYKQKIMYTTHSADCEQLLYCDVRCPSVNFFSLQWPPPKPCKSMFAMATERKKIKNLLNHL